MAVPKALQLGIFLGTLPTSMRVAIFSLLQNAVKSSTAGPFSCSSSSVILPAAEEASVIEPSRDEAKAELQEAMSRIAQVCCSSDGDSDKIYHDLLLSVSYSSSSAQSSCPQHSIKLCINWHSSSTHVLLSRLTTCLLGVWRND